MTRRCLVIGIDGMPRTLLEDLAGDGVMPFVDSLLAEGNLRPLTAPVPEVSSTSWAAFLTGANPGESGIFGFTDVDAGPRLLFPTLDSLAAAPLWEHVARAGGRTVCLNVPSTYPARAIEGALVSGFVAPLPERAFHPSSLRGELAPFNYQLDVDVSDAAVRPEAFLSRLHTTLDGRAAAFEYVLDRERADVAVAVITESDRMQHFLWSSVSDPSAPLHEAAVDIYRHIDRVVARVARTAGPDDALFLVSDHGFGPLSCTFNISEWLRREGYLALAHGEGLDAIDARSAAFALDPARVYVLDGRFRRGVSSRDARAIAAGIREALLRLRWTPPDQVGEHGQLPLFRDVLLRDEVYAGALIERAPDLVAVPTTGIALRASAAERALVGHDTMTGMHTRDNAMFYARRRALPDGPIDMQCVLPIVLGSVGIPFHESKIMPLGGMVVC